MDESRGLHYVLKDGKRLYFRRNTPLDKIARNYRELVMEQDKRSPHHYLESIKEVTGKTFVDIGCAEVILRWKLWKRLDMSICLNKMSCG